MRVLIADDEELARSYLRTLLEEQKAEIVGEAADAMELLAMAEDLKPDLVTMDIEMPGMTGMQAAAALGHMDPAPQVVFVTGYSEHAVEAFEHKALDYLLKPVAPERLAETLVRARQAQALAKRARRDEMVKSARREGVIRRLPIRETYSVRLVPVEKILFATAREKAVFVTTPGGEYKTYYSLNYLEEVLPKELFIRVHASCIVNVAQIEQINFLGNHTYSITLVSGPELPVGRTYYGDLQKRFGLDRVVKS